MEVRLKHLNQELASVLHDLQTSPSHISELAAAHATPQDAADLPIRTPELEKSIELLHQLELILTPPLHVILDSIFGRRAHLAFPVHWSVIKNKPWID